MIECKVRRLSRVATWVCATATVTASLTLPMVALAATPGLAVKSPAVARVSAAAAESSNALKEFYSATGPVYLSTDGAGSTSSESIVDVEKRSPQSVVRKAFLFAASLPGGGNIPDGGIRLSGTVVDFDESASIYTGYGMTNVAADVTAIIKPIVDASPHGRIGIAVTETVPWIDGEILAVVFDDPNEPAGSVTLLFGGQNPAGDSFAVRLSDPISAANDAQKLSFALGISYGYQTSANASQYSTVDVNGVRLTSAAGGQDDGANANGALLTVGGVDDQPGNPADAYALGNCEAAPRCDDELYDLKAVLADGTTLIDVSTSNPSSDDNIFFASFASAALAAVVNEGIVLSPTTQSLHYGEVAVMTATLQDSDGVPLVGREVTFEVTSSGPNQGIGGYGTTSPEGSISFALYCGVNETVGNDTAVARFVDSKGETKESNEAEMLCSKAASSLTASAELATRTVTLRATLVTEDNLPLVGRMVQFASAKKPVCSSMTDADGVASCASTRPVVNGTLARTYTASFAGDGVSTASSATAELAR